jgi:hypothetical protein
VILPGFVVLALLAPAYVTRRVDDIQLQVGCQSARSNVEQMHALASIARSLGIPRTFDIPKVPAECADH